MTARLDALARRLRAEGARTAPPLAPDDARSRLHLCDGPVGAAVAFEALAGGLTVRGFELGLDTHRQHPPRGGNDVWLDRSKQRLVAQIAFGGPGRATYWLDDAGWVHEIAPLDRLRPVSSLLEDFLEAVLDGRTFTSHTGVLALARLDPDAADAFLGCVEGCPVGKDVVRWPDASLQLLEESEWLERALPEPRVVVSAPALALIAEPLAALLACEPTLQMAFLDEMPPSGIPLVETVVRTTYRLPYPDREAHAAFGRDAMGTFQVVAVA